MLWWTVKLFSELKPFFQILKFEYGFSRFLGFLVLFSWKKGDTAVISLSNDKHNSTCYHRENYFELTRLQNFSWITLANRGLEKSMVSAKCGFRLEQCFSTLMFFLTNIVAASLFSAKNPKNSQMKQVHWNAFLVYPVNAPILNTT